MAQNPQQSQQLPQFQFLAPNLWNLSGGGISVRYSNLALPGPAGGPHFIYQDNNRTLNFSGNQIRSVQVPDLGTILSVTLQIVPDLGSTTFSLLLPLVNLTFQGSISSAPVRTEGLTTFHQTSLFPPLNHGQRESYTVTLLTGTASLVRTE